MIRYEGREYGTAAEIASHWSQRARERQARREPDYGLLWESDHLRSLDAEEHEHWSKHTLPFGWSIVRTPDAAR